MMGWSKMMVCEKGTRDAEVYLTPFSRTSEMGG
jgi:hypothetical protein